MGLPPGAATNFLHIYDYYLLVSHFFLLRPSQGVDADRYFMHGNGNPVIFDSASE